MGLYALWALRDEVARLAAPELLPADERQRLRLEDLLGFRRNPTTATPLFVATRARALDGHPTPATPFVRLATGASGVGLASSIGLAMAARDRLRRDCPARARHRGRGRAHAGRVSEALAAAGTASPRQRRGAPRPEPGLDRQRPCLPRGRPAPATTCSGSPVSCSTCTTGTSCRSPTATTSGSRGRPALRRSRIDNGQPTALVYRTRKGWKYGVEGRASHGAGHKLCSAGFYQLARRADRRGRRRAADLRPRATRSCAGPPWRPGARGVLLGGPAGRAPAASRRTWARWRRRAGARLAAAQRAARRARPQCRAGRAARRRRLRACRSAAGAASPDGLRLDAGRERRRCATPWAARWRVQQRASGGALLTASADLLGSTSVAADRRRLCPGLLERRHEPRGAAARRGRHLRGRHVRRALGHLGLWSGHRRGLLLRRLHGAPRAHRRAASRHRRPGARRFDR